MQELKYYIIGTAVHARLTSYFNNRKQLNQNSGSVSNLVPVECEEHRGAPLQQCSLCSLHYWFDRCIKSTVVCALYITDLINASKVLKYVMRAEDANIFCSSIDIDPLIHSLNLEMTHTCEWFGTNRLLLNYIKTSCIIFHIHKPVLLDTLSMITLPWKKKIPRINFQNPVSFSHAEYENESRFIRSRPYFPNFYDKGLKIN